MIVVKNVLIRINHVENKKMNGLIDKVVISFVIVCGITIMIVGFLSLADIKIAAPAWLQWLVWFGAIPLGYIWFKLIRRRE